MELQETQDSVRRISERFWPKVQIAGEDECWTWTGGEVGSGYGGFYFRGRTRTAHRMSWMLANNQEIPEGMVAMHSCDNPACVNPRHLSIGTVPDNIADKCRKGRQPHGDTHPSRLKPGCMRKGDAHHYSKLTSEKVIAIRERAGTTKINRLADEYRVSPGTIRLVIHRKTWAHI